MGARENGEVERDQRSTEIEREIKQAKKISKKESSEINNNSSSNNSRGRTSKAGSTKLHYNKTPNNSNNNNNNNKNNTPKKSQKTNKSISNHRKSESAIIDEEIVDVLDEAPNCDQSNGTDDEALEISSPNREVERLVAVNGENEKASRAEELELQARVEKLEEELLEVASLEISIYSVVAEHSTSADKVHTPVRRLARFYLNSCKFLSENKKSDVANNIVSGLALVAKSCGNDVSRLMFWLSNIVVLRENISLNGNDGKRINGDLLKTQETNGSNSKQVRKVRVPELKHDWQGTSTFVDALERIESWIFSRVVESVWWQALTPYMQSAMEDLPIQEQFEILSGPKTGNVKQGKFSVSLWRNAFQDAFAKLCPVRASGQHCGCLPSLAKLVMEECVARLDVAMFNAILRESVHEMPTDPVSDPIVDTQVLPIPPGYLSFGSGAQIKKSIGKWSRWLTDMFGMDPEDSRKENGININKSDDDRRDTKNDLKWFSLLNELSDLLMLPKDLLLDPSIRLEVCPSFGLSLVTRILCNFTPDEFCPDTVPVTVLDELNFESMLQPPSDQNLIRSTPCAAKPVVYHTPSPADVARVQVVGPGKDDPDNLVSLVNARGYTSDDDLDELDSTQNRGLHANERYRLLREVWSL